MTAPTLATTLATTPADITLPDLERAARSPLTWQIDALAQAPAA